MKRPDPATARADFDRNAFLVLLVVLTVAFAWIVWPFYGGVFWAAVLALLFEPMYLRLVVRMGPAEFWACGRGARPRDLPSKQTLRWMDHSTHPR